MSPAEFYVISVKHTQREHAYITVWRPKAKGYAWPLSWAGKYSADEINTNLDYYHRGDDSLAVPCLLLDDLAVPPTKGAIDNDAGPVVLNNKANWQKILGWISTFEPRPAHFPQPQYKGARRPR